MTRAESRYTNTKADFRLYSIFSRMEVNESFVNALDNQKEYPVIK